MDRNSPDYYIEETEESLQQTEEFIKWTLARSNPLVKPIVTPRFVPTCTPRLLKGLGDVISFSFLFFFLKKKLISF